MKPKITFDNFTPCAQGHIEFRFHVEGSEAWDLRRMRAEVKQMAEEMERALNKPTLADADFVCRDCGHPEIEWTSWCEAWSGEPTGGDAPDNYVYCARCEDSQEKGAVTIEDFDMREAWGVEPREAA